MSLNEYVGAFSAILIALAPTTDRDKASNMTPCTPSTEPAITVTVSDAQTGTPLEATVILTDKNFQEELNLQGITAAGQIIYGGAFERPGVYRVSVSRDGYETSALENIKVNRGNCHVITRNLRVVLKPINL